MARKGPRTDRADRREPTWPVPDGENAVSEFTAEQQGALSPFGEDLGLPLPADEVRYEHPGPETRPNR